MHFYLCNFISDLVQNSLEANAKKIEILFVQSKATLTITIKDNGEGMAPEILKQITNPFYTNGKKHPKRKIGMGIPFLIQTTDQTNGSWNIQSKKNVGTTLFIKFDLNNIDTPPIGDISGLFRQLLTLPGSFEMIIIRKKTNFPFLEYTLERSKIIETLGSLKTTSNLILLEKYLKSQEETES